MLINTNLPIPADSTASDLQNSRSAANNSANSNASSAGTTEGPAMDASRWQGLSGPQDEIPSEAEADQLTGSLRATMFSQPGMIFAAQAHLDPQSVYNLLQ
jgi:hypothetical protein